MQNRDLRVSKGPFLGLKTKTSVRRRYKTLKHFMLQSIFDDQKLVPFNWYIRHQVIVSNDFRTLNFV